MTPWLFGIGWSKSGTHSLAEACSTLGLKALHFGDSHFRDQAPARQKWLDNAMHGLPLCEGLDGYDVVTDWPVCRDWRSLAIRRPEAKFVLTYRPPDDCAISWMRMLLANPEVMQDDWPTRADEFARDVEHHVSDVCEYFLRSPQRLLILDMRDDDDTKWRLLSQFIARPAPGKGTPFPRAFSHADFMGGT